MCQSGTNFSGKKYGIYAFRLLLQPNLKIMKTFVLVGLPNAEYTSTLYI